MIYSALKWQQKNIFLIKHSKIIDKSSYLSFSPKKEKDQKVQISEINSAKMCTSIQYAYKLNIKINHFEGHIINGCLTSFKTKLISNWLNTKLDFFLLS